MRISNLPSHLLSGHIKQIPAGLWNVYSSVEDCCAVNFPFSDVCIPQDKSASPTKYPTINVVESSIETVPLRFGVEGLPDDVNMRELKDEMRSVLMTIITMLAKNIPDMKLSSIEERVARRRLGNDKKEDDESITRELLRNSEVLFDVNFIRVEGKKFGPLLIQGIKDSMADIQNLMETTKGKYFQSNVNVNFCTLSSGKYTLCSSTPAPVKRPAQIMTVTEPEPSGLPGWAIALIVIFVLLLVGCMCYLMFISARDGNVYDKDMEDMYADEMKSYRSSRSRGGRSHRSGRSYSSRSRRSSRSRGSRSRRSSSRSRRSGYTSRRSRRTEESGMLVIAAKAEDPAFGDEFTVDTYKTARKRGPDPSVYNPNAIDPDGSVDNNDLLMLTNGDDPEEGTMMGGQRRYMEDPPLKPKRKYLVSLDGILILVNTVLISCNTINSGDPTMYVDGFQNDDPSLYSAKYGQGSVGSARFASDPEDEIEDPFGAYPKQSSKYMGSESGAEYARGSKDPSFYQQGSHHAKDPTFYEAQHTSDQSFRTQEPSVAEKPRRSHKSSQSHRKGHLEESLASSWGDVIDGMGQMRQKSKSFY
jgi:hypothetical protein